MDRVRKILHDLKRIDESKKILDRALDQVYYDISTLYGGDDDKKEVLECRGKRLSGLPDNWLDSIKDAFNWR